MNHCLKLRYEDLTTHKRESPTTNFNTRLFDMAAKRSLPQLSTTPLSPHRLQKSELRGVPGSHFRKREHHHSKHLPFTPSRLTQDIPDLCI